jgi:hypothetical protein
MDTTLFSLFEEANLLKLRNRFSRASLREMSLHWLPFSQQVSIMSFLTTEIRQNPQLWATLLLSLSDEECYRLTTTWEEEENYQEGQSVERLSQESVCCWYGFSSPFHSQSHCEREGRMSVQELCQQLLTPAVDEVTSLEV